MTRRRSETAAWREVQDAAAELKDSRFEHIASVGRQLDQLAREMRAQLVEGVHENPALMIVGNPPRRRSRSNPRSDWSDRVYAIQYRHKGDGRDYEHDFERGVSLRANEDGSVTLYRKDGRPVWEEFPG